MTATTPSLPGGLSRAQALRWRNGIFAIFGMLGLGIASWMARLPAIKLALDISTAQTGFLIFALALGSMVGLGLASHVISWFGTRAITMATFLIAPFGLAVAGFAVTVGQVFAVVFAGLALFGFALSTCDVAMNLSGAVNERVLGRTMMPIFHAFFSMGTIVGAGLGALGELIHLPIAVHIGIITALMVAVGFTGARGVQSEHILREDEGGAEAGSGGWRERLAIWKDPRTLLLGVVVLGMAFSEGSAGDWISLASVEGHGVDRAAGALIFGVFVTAMTVGRLAGVRLLDRYGRVPVLQGSAVLAAVGLALFIFVPDAWVAVLGVALWGLGTALGFPTGMSAAADDPRTAAARVSAVATIGYVAFLVGPPMIGFLGEHFGLLHALIVVLVLMVIAGFASFSTKESTAAQPTQLGP